MKLRQEELGLTLLWQVVSVNAGINVFFSVKFFTFFIEIFWAPTLSGNIYGAIIQSEEKDLAIGWDFLLSKVLFAW